MVTIGQKYGDWLLIEKLPNNYHLCRCACGVEKPVRNAAMKAGKSNRCGGCARKKRAAEQKATIIHRKATHMIKRHGNKYERCHVLSTTESGRYKVLIFGVPQRVEFHDRHRILPLNEKQGMRFLN